MSSVESAILLGDCLDEMRKLKENTFDLIYLDPPFFSEKKHSLSNRDRNECYTFNDIWGSATEYAEFLKARINIMYNLLKDTGSIFVHCDRNSEHIVRMILNEIFGEDYFQSEIIWYYKRWSNAKKGLLPAHQNLYFYTKSKRFHFNTLYTGYSKTTNIDQILQRRTRDENNKTKYDVDDNGEFLACQKKGVPLSDVWEIPYLNPKAKERVGYPTQKPVLLLERIIRLVTNEGDLVLDPFCGSGTTCVAAKLLKRRYIGIDQSKDAVALAKDRLARPVRTESKLMRLGREAYDNADKRALALLTGLEYNPVQRNRGIDAILKALHDDAPVIIRVQKENETLQEAAGQLLKAKKVKRAEFAFLIQTQNYGLFDQDSDYDGIIVLNSPALQIREYLKK